MGMTYLTGSEIRHRISSRPRLSLRARLGLARQRRALAALDDRALADIGLTRDAAESEARRPFWDAPESWTD